MNKNDEYYSSDKIISERRNKFRELISKKHIMDSNFNKLLSICPCCGYPKSNSSLCNLCLWDDDGQDDSNAKLVRGGPNGLLSLEQARTNFKKCLNYMGKKLNIIDKNKILIKMKCFETALNTENNEDINKLLKEI